MSAAYLSQDLVHAMPFGAEIMPGGGVRFRLWAPAANTVDLFFENRNRPMEKAADGWFQLIESSAGAGTLYRYRINGGQLVPDPASRFQPQDAEGPSEVIDAGAFAWDDLEWKGRPWEEAVIYELHVGSFTPGGTYRSIIPKLQHLKDVGVTALELMPLADFAGRRNWGYDGVLPFAPDSAYGRPDDLKALVQAAHKAGLMVLLDVVYNHFGPKGNFLSLYAPQFFTDRYRTPWGAAINFDGAGSRWVREYFVQNALYWLEEYGFDGLRFDAVHAIIDKSPLHVLDEIASRARNAPALAHRQIHLVLENDANQARLLGKGKYTAQWNDDSHHAYHVLATGEQDGYYVAYADAPTKHLARCLAEGFAFQGESSAFTREKRGEPSAHLPPSAFVDFMQNHDQIGNRAFGERLLTLVAKDKKNEKGEERLKALTAILLLAPSPPMLFMGEEWGCRQPFLFFCDFEGELGQAVRKGRREEFARFAAFQDPAVRERIPDPLAEATFRQCVLRWDEMDRDWLAFYRNLLSVRRKEIFPRKAKPGRYEMLAERVFSVLWPLEDGGVLRLLANCGEAPFELSIPPRGRLLWGKENGKTLEGWSATWLLEE
jgi:malto-oligosyltrehalose trehalohydrolase